MKKENLRFVCKRGNLELVKKDLKKFGEERAVVVTKKIKLSKKEFRVIADNLFDKVDFLANSCEWKNEYQAYTAVEVTDGAQSIVIETQGYDYPRYVAIR